MNTTVPRPRVTFRLAYLPANQAWCLTWGLALIDLDGRRLFDSRGEVVKALGEHGLRVTTSGEVLPAEDGDSPVRPSLQD